MDAETATPFGSQPVTTPQVHEKVVAAVVSLDVDSAPSRPSMKRAMRVLQLVGLVVVDRQVCKSDSLVLGVSIEIETEVAPTPILCERRRRAQ